MTRDERVDKNTSQIASIPDTNSVAADIMKYIADVNHSVYVKKRTIAVMYGISTKTVERRLASMSAYIGKGKRYQKYVIVKPRKTVLILLDAFKDFMTNGEHLANGIPCTHWEPPFGRRYPSSTIVANGRIFRVKEDALIDFMKHWNLLFDGMDIPDWTGRLL